MSLKSKPADLYCGDKILARTEATMHNEPVEFEVVSFHGNFMRCRRHAKGGTYLETFLYKEFNMGQVKKRGKIGTQ